MTKPSEYELVHYQAEARIERIRRAWAESESRDPAYQFSRDIEQVLDGFFDPMLRYSTMPSLLRLARAIGVNNLHYIRDLLKYKYSLQRRNTSDKTLIRKCRNNHAYLGRDFVTEVVRLEQVEAMDRAGALLQAASTVFEKSKILFPGDISAQTKWAPVGLRALQNRFRKWADEVKRDKYIPNRVIGAGELPPRYSIEDLKGRSGPKRKSTNI